MTSLKKIITFTVISLSVVMASCDKDDTNNDVVTANNVPMTGAQEVPAKTTAASGNFNVAYNKKDHMLNYTVNWSGLTGNPTGSHIHGTAAIGVNAGIKHDFFSALPKTASGTYTGSVTVDGSAIKEDSLLAGFYYFNIHTPTNPGGEIRGQIKF